jgi:protein gp37
MAKRLKAMGQPNYARGFEPSVHEQSLSLPLRWKKPRIIFVNSMSDLFHERIPFDFIEAVFAMMRAAHWHTFQVLTKRSERLWELSNRLTWPKNVWMGVSVESQEYSWRVDHLRETRAFIKFLSLEPLLGPIPDLDLDGIGWVVVGGESGPHARPVNAVWVREIRDQCLASGVPFFFKQWGGKRKKLNGRELDGRVWKAMPAAG